MSHRLLAIAPSLLLAVAVVFARSSGNDKSPFVVLAVLALLMVLFLGSLVAALRGGFSQGNAPWLVLGAACPLAYAGTVFALSRGKLVDPLLWLGFR